MKNETGLQRKRGASFFYVAILLTFLLASQPVFCLAADRVVGNMMLINDNGGWCWYQDDKIIYDPTGGNVIISTAGHSSGFGSVAMDVTTFNVATGKRTQVVASTDAGDDHDMGALWVRPDGRYLHMYAPHYSSNDETYYRLATNPHDGSTWGSQQSYNWKNIPGPTRPAETQNLSYTNVHYLSGEGTGQGRLYNIARVFTRTPNLSYSDDWGQTWQYMGRLNSPVGGETYSNFYHKFRGNGVDRIDFIGTEQHPRDYTNSVYHGYIKNGKSYNSYGDEIDTINDTTAPSVQAFTPVFSTGPVAAGEYHTGWTNEIEIDSDGRPVCLFQTRYGTGSYGGETGAADHRFFYGRFDGSAWTITELGKMGPGLHSPEQDYIGMGCIHPDDVNLIYISTPFDPRDDSALSKHEIFKGVTPDNGLTWNWTQITIDSTVDNIRPAIPQWDKNNTAVFWTRGSYPGQENYDFVVVGMVEQENQTLGLVNYIDATTSNTKNADDTTFSPTGPSGSAGSADGKWHEYTGYGNGGSCYTAGDGGTENVPTIKTTITGLANGTYDVFAYFWCDPAQDWGIRGGFESSDLLCFNKQSSQWAEASQFSGSVTVVSGSYQLYRVYIGRKQVSGGASVVVYLDNYDSSFSNAPTRTTFDGVGVASVTFEEDITAPTPNPMTWALVPTATGESSIEMTATTATDISGVEYYFDCLTAGGHDSGWQDSTTYTDTGLSPSTQYTYRVQAHDKSPNQNPTGWSSEQSATTEPPSTDIEIIGSWATGTTHAKESGYSRALIFIAHGERAGDMNLNSVTYGGQEMIKVLERTVSSGNPTTYAYVVAYILNEAGVAAASSGTFVPSWDTTPTEVSYASVFFSNVNQTTPVGTSASNSVTSGNTVTTSALTTNNGDVVVLGATCGNSGNYTLNNSFSKGYESDMSSSTGTGGHKSATGTAETPSVTHSGPNRQVIIGFVLKAGASPDLPPASPTGLAATSGNVTVSLDWNDNIEADLAGYNVYRSTASGSGYTKINGSLAISSDYTDNTVTNGITYYYVVTAVDAISQESGYSNEASATPTLTIETCEDVQAGGYRLLSDLTGDCYVDVEDLGVMAYYWLHTDCSGLDNCEESDFEPDGDVDFADFSDFALQWLECNDPENPDCLPNW